jgi:murE/murF fusion protein
MQMVGASSGYSILNDTYNANPASMAAGLKTLKQTAQKTSVALIGDMLELGTSSNQAHYEIGKLIADLEIDYVGVVGNYRDDVRKGAVAHGFEEKRIEVFESKEELVGWVSELAGRIKLGKNDLILVKASRGLRFETVVEKLTK